MVEDVVVGFEHAVRQPVFTHELPDVLDRVQFRAFGGQWHECDVVRHNEPVRHMPAGLIDQQHGVRARRNLSCDFGEMQTHRLDVASGQDEARGLAFLRTDRAEDIGRGGALIMRRGRSRATFRPAPRDLVFLPYPRFVLEPDLYRGWIEALLPRDFVQARWEVFLKSSMAPSACA